MTAEADPLFADFEQRIAKRYRHLRRWAARQDTDAFRVYDRDIPDMVFTLDAYGSDFLLQWYPRRHQDVPAGWLDAAAQAAAHALGQPPERIVARARRKVDRRHEQHELTGGPGRPLVVREAGLAFRVDLGRSVDTGLFLDHRPLRAEVRSLSAGASVLNLYCYTGSFSVHALAGGASRVVSVDLSNTYLRWAAENLELNGFAATRGGLVRADVSEWLQQAAQRRERFDLIVLDPPAFSSSAAMEAAFAVQRDHKHLIGAALGVLSPAGVLYFSTNLRDFRFEAECPGWRAEDITARTIPEDFRDRRVHHCWRIAAG